jgi:geranylgeranyl pyrophosphate synthase
LITRIGDIRRDRPEFTMSGSATLYLIGNGQNADVVCPGTEAADSSRDCATGYERVLSSIEEIIAEISVSPQQRALLQTAVVGLQRSVVSNAESGDRIPSIDLRLGVYAAITGSDEAAVSLAAAGALVCLSVKLFDDLADGDRQSHWAGYSAGEINLAAATVLSALPQLILARLDLTPPRRLRMQQILAEGLLRISAGQQVDLALTGTHEVSVAEVEAAVIGKTGERFATYCRLAAEMAAASPQAMADSAAFGREIGVARQLISDCHELLVDPECRDITHGARTMPIVAHINRLSGADRSRFLDCLDRARTDRRAEQSVRQELREADEISRVIFRARLRYGRARAIVDRLGAREPGRARLLRLASPGAAEFAAAGPIH